MPSSYARRYEPSAVVDCATLTGACHVALGDYASGLMGNDEDLISEIQTAGKRPESGPGPFPSSTSTPSRYGGTSPT